MLRPAELISRWTTDSGQVIRCNVLIALLNRTDFRKALRGLPGTLEIPDGLDLRGIALESQTFATDGLVGVSLDFACLDYCKFSYSALDHVDVSYATFKHAIFSDTQMTLVTALHTVFDHARFENVLFAGSNLSYSSFSDSKWASCDLGRCRCVGNNFADSELQRVRFSDATIAHVNFRGAKAIECNFQDARVHKTTLPGGIGVTMRA